MAVSNIVSVTITKGHCCVKHAALLTAPVDKRWPVGEAINRCDLSCKLRLVVARVVVAATAVSIVCNEIK